jgi:CHRD domain
MKRLGLMILASAGCMLVLGDAASAQQVRRAERLLGGNENPPVITDGTGNFRARLFDDRIEFRLRYDVGFDDSDVTQAHLHIANPGNNGTIVAFLCSNVGNTPAGATVRACPPSPEVIEGDIVAADVQAVSEGDPAVTIIEAGDLEGLARLIRQSSVYANVHSDDFPAGEIRGQLNPRER